MQTQYFPPVSETVSIYSKFLVINASVFKLTRVVFKLSATLCWLYLVVLQYFQNVVYTLITAFRSQNTKYTSNIDLHFKRWKRKYYTFFFFTENDIYFNKLNNQLTKLKIIIIDRYSLAWSIKSALWVLLIV